MGRKRTILWNIVGIAFGVVSMFVLICVAQSFHARSQAVSLNNALQQLTVGITTENQAREIFSRFRAEDKPVGGWVLDTVAEGPVYNASNRGLSILHLAEPTHFYVSIFFSNGIVVRKNAGLRVGDTWRCCFIDVSESADNFNDITELMPHGIFIHKEEGLVRIYIDNRVSQATRRAVFNFNYACLTSISGCRTLDQVLPDAPQLESP